MKIIFMGTPDFACPTLQKLLATPEFEIVGIYTREPQISGRGHKINNSPIHEIALAHGLPVFTPRNFRNEFEIAQFINLHADAAVVVAYGLILPQKILDATKFGCINLHPSLLPRWRGASPIQYTLFAGDEQMGISIIKMNADIDSGDIILQRKFEVAPRDNYSNLAPRLAEIGAQMIVESLVNLHHNKAHALKQDNALATFSKKLKKEESLINWNLSAQEILQKIRGLSGCLTAYFIHNGARIKIYDAEIIYANSNKNPGEIVDEKLTIECAQNQIRPLILQKEGGKIIKIEEFLCGFLAKE